MRCGAGGCRVCPSLLGCWASVSGRRPFGGTRLDAALGIGFGAGGGGGGGGLGGGWSLCEVLSTSIGPPLGGGGGLGGG